MAQKRKVSIEIASKATGTAEIKKVGKALKTGFDQGLAAVDRFDDRMDKAFKDLDQSAQKSGQAIKGQFSKPVKKAFTDVDKEAARAAKGIARAFSALGVKSTKSLKREIKTLTQAYKTLKHSGTATAKDLERAQVALRNKVRNLRAEFKKTGPEISGAFKKGTQAVSGFRGALGLITGTAGLYAVKRAIGSIITTFAGFDDVMRSVGAVSGATADELEALREIARKMGRETRYSAVEAAEGLQFLGMAGLNVTQMIKALPGVLQMAASGGLELGQAADIATNVLDAYGFKVKDLGRVNDVLAKTFTSTNSVLGELAEAFKMVGPIAKGVGGDFEDLVAAIGMLHSSGIKGTMAGTSLRGAINGLLNPTAEEAKLMKDLAERMGGVNLQVKDSKGNFIGFANVIKQLEKAGIRGEESLKLFGQRAGPGMQALVTQGSAALRSLTYELKNSGGTAERIAKDKEAGIGGALRRLKAGFEGLMVTLGKDFEPVVNAVAKALTALTGVLEKIPQGVRRVIEVGLSLVGVFAAWKLVIKPLFSLLPGIANLIRGIGSAAPSVAKTSTAVRGLGAAAAGASAGVVRLSLLLKGGLAIAAAASVIQIGRLIYKLGEWAMASREVSKAEERTAGLQDRLKAKLAEVNKQLGTNFKTYEEFDAAVERGQVVWDKMAGAWRNAGDAARDAASGFQKVNVVWKSQTISTMEQVRKLARMLGKDFDTLGQKAAAAARKMSGVKSSRGMSQGGLAFAGGGLLPGFGGGDKIRAMLEPGEFVMRKDAVRNLGADFLYQLQAAAAKGTRNLFSNFQMPEIPRFQAGGLALAGSGPAKTYNFNLRAGQSEFPVMVQGKSSRDMMFEVFAELQKLGMVRK